MNTIIKQFTRLTLLITLTFCIHPVVGLAAVAVQAKLVSGKVIQIFNNNSVKLDNGQVYLPSRQGLTVDVGVGESVTLRYVIESEGKNFFFESSPGMNSLEAAQPTPSKTDNTPK